MEQGRLAFTAVYLKSNHGYIGFIEELPGVNSHGRTLDEARDLFNMHLAARGFTLLRRGEILGVVKLDKLNPALVPRVEPGEGVGKDDFVWRYRCQTLRV